MLSPSGVARVCSGEELAITCSTDRSFLEWNVTIVSPESEQNVSRSRLISSVGSIDPLRINMRTFNISRTTNALDGSSASLQSIIVITVTVDLNGTVVRCTDIGSSLAEKSTSAVTVHVIRTDQGELDWLLDTHAHNQAMLPNALVNIPSSPSLLTACTHEQR